MPHIPERDREILVNDDESQNAVDLELWGGVECTINRVGDRYFEQLGRTGHLSRLSDFDRFAQLGIKALRHPILWEFHRSHGFEAARWSWANKSLRRLAELAIHPIVGLVHHGSGPKWTNLMDPNFPTELASYAEQVATRFPELRDYTPVNEPMTTARFSALYGHWFPHHSDEHSFACALLNQCRAIVLSMEAIRRVNPSARLIQTDDLGKTYSTPALSYQAEFENERRWCSYDLLCGQLDRTHRLWHHFLWAGIAEGELEWFLDHPCPPQVIGINHYLSGERYLDEHIDRYPADARGGNGRDAYADVLAARTLSDGTAGAGELLLEAWRRYKNPVAITECHNGCTREEQLRWFLEVWRSAQRAQEEGAHVVAVTAWSLLGAFDWDHLVTREDHHYEPGVYDIRSTPPRPTALASLLTTLAKGNDVSHPLLDVPGWWHRPQRFIYGIRLRKNGDQEAVTVDSVNANSLDVRPLLITGGSGMLAGAFARICELRGIPYRLVSRRSLDITKSASVARALDEFQPWAIINAAGYAGVDDAELQPIRCFQENAQGAFMLGTECARRSLPFLTFSSDLVFDGNKQSQYVEQDVPLPLNVYGSTKAEAENLVADSMPSALIVRSGAFFGPWDGRNFVVSALRALVAAEPFDAAANVIISPTYVPDLVNASLDLLIDGESGIWHLANVGQISWAELAATAAALARVSSRTLRACPLEDLHLRARRPLFSPLTSERGILMPTLDDALARFLRECEIDWKSSKTSAADLAA
jgi:dTDP-4-dehydrorhamnose reductase